ncbi:MULTISPECIES: hypothetical protein [unclassified Ensifer]|uniref:hypothetical protein n=1 Tax=unclassified Ensifer TaxID=2633371 RepID=UPI00300FF009
MIGLVLHKPQMWVAGASISALLFLLFLAVVSIFHDNSTIYPRDDEGLRQLVHSGQCEMPADQSPIVEIQNTLSNMAYALAGTLILLCVRSWAGHLLAINLILLAIFSGLYHAVLAELPQVLDVAWVYAALLSLSIYISFVHVQAERPYGMAIWWWILCGTVLAASFIILPLVFRDNALVTLVAFVDLMAFVVSVNGLCWLARKKFPALIFVVAPVVCLFVPVFGYLMRAELHWDSDAVFPIMIILLVLQLVVLCASARSLDWSVVGLELALIGAAVVPGFAFRLLDGYTKTGGRRWLCSPDSLFQAHAHWHILSAAALLLAYDLVSRFQPLAGDDGDRPVFFPQQSAIASH